METSMQPAVRLAILTTALLTTFIYKLTMLMSLKTTRIRRHLSCWKVHLFMHRSRSFTMNRPAFVIALRRKP